MESKKTPKADLEKRKFTHWEIGLVIILILTLGAFNIKSYDREEKEVSKRTAETEIEDVVIQTQQEETPPPPPEEPEVVEEEPKAEPAFDLDLNGVENVAAHLGLDSTQTFSL